MAAPTSSICTQRRGHEDWVIRAARRVYPRGMNTRHLLLGALVALGGCTTGGNDSGTASITGTATYRERMMLPPGAVLEVTLEDVSSADAPADVIARNQSKILTGPPFAFTLPYDPSRINSGHRYNVRANITADGAAMFQSDAGYAVLGAANVMHVDILMKRVSAADSAASSQPQQPRESPRATAQLENTYWKIMTLNGKRVHSHDGAPEVHFVLTRENRRMRGFGGCNSLSGGYELQGDRIKFIDIARTLMACTYGMDTERELHEMYPRVAGWKITGEVLQLTDASGTVIAAFESRYMK
jgi:putative lipoprotein